MAGWLATFLRSIKGEDSPEREYVDVGAAAFHAKAQQEVETQPTHRIRRGEQISELAKEIACHSDWRLAGESFDPARADMEFEFKCRFVTPPEDRLKDLYTKVAGVSHNNDDGTSRIEIIKECEVFELLNIRHDPQNKFDLNAIAVERNTGGQLGWLEAHLASEVVRDCAKHGPYWSAIFRHPTHHPETGKVVGAVLYMIRYSEEYLERNAEELAAKQPISM